MIVLDLLPPFRASSYNIISYHNALREAFAAQKAKEDYLKRHMAGMVWYGYPIPIYLACTDKTEDITLFSYNLTSDITTLHATV